MVRNNSTFKQKGAKPLEDEAKFRVIADYMYDWEYWTDPEAHLLFVSPSCKRLTGYSAEEFINKPSLLYDIIHPNDKPSLKDHFTVITKEPAHIRDFRIITRTGETRWLSHACQPAYDEKGNFLGRRVSNRDITDCKKAEEELARYSEKLEHLVKERTAQLETTQQQLIKAERLAAIGELAGMIGHDLRNPLTGIKTSVYYIKKNLYNNKSEAKSKEMVEIIEKCIDHSNKIISDLLEYSREIQLQVLPCTPKMIISDTIEMMKTPNNITLINAVTNEARLHVDYDKMKRVFSNLIKNSIEAMPNGGQLTITCTQTKECFEFSFADTGPGIPDDIMKKIFLPLVTSKAQGMGFGLAICRRIVEAHSGVITVETSSMGTNFTLKVPAVAGEIKNVDVHLKANLPAEKRK